MTESLVVFGAVGLCAWVLLRRAWALFRGRGGCGCGAPRGCPAARGMAARIERLADPAGAEGNRR